MSFSGEEKIKESVLEVYQALMRYLEKKYGMKRPINVSCSVMESLKRKNSLKKE